MQEEDRQGRLHWHHSGRSRLDWERCLAIGADLLFQSAGRAIAALNLRRDVPPKAPTKENEEEMVHKRVAAVSKPVRPGGVNGHAPHVSVQNSPRSKARAWRGRTSSDSGTDEWRFVLTGEIGPATDPVEVDYTALKSENNLGGAKRRLEDQLARQASLPNETRCGH